jgi:Domain of unknown function (DUF4160)
MPTVLRLHGLRFVIWPNDHAPPHVHVFAPDAEATLQLGGADGYPRLIQNRRMKRSDVARALRAVHEHRALLQRRWSEIHG